MGGVIMTLRLRRSLRLAERVAGGMQANHQAPREEERDVRARLAADGARFLGRIL